MVEEFTQERLQAADRYEQMHLVACRIGSVGWYFWNTSQTEAKGPFKTEAEAQAAEQKERTSNPDWFS